MAQLVLTVAGYAIGTYFGYPQLGAAVGAYVGGRYEASKQRIDATSRIDDLSVRVSAYGVPIPKTWGNDRVGCVPIWSTDLVETTSTTGGKGGGGPKVTTNSFTVSFAVLVGEGQVKSIRRMWADALLIYDARPGENVTSQAESAAWRRYWTFYQGTEDQDVDPTMEAIDGVGNVPAYRGYSYIVFAELPLAKWGNRLPQISVEIAGAVEEDTDENWGEDPGVPTLEPLVIYPWTYTDDGRPIHSLGPTTYKPFSQFSLPESEDFEAQAAAQAVDFGADNSHYRPEAGALSANYMGWGYWFTDNYPELNLYSGNLKSRRGLKGASFRLEDPQYCYIKLGAYKAGDLPASPTPYMLNAAVATHTPVWPVDGAAAFNSEVVQVYRLEHGGGGAPPVGYSSLPYGQVTAPDDPGSLSTAWPNYLLTMREERVPWHAPVSCYPGGPCQAVLGFAEKHGNSSLCVSCFGQVKPNLKWVIVTGTAKQLCAVEYRNHVLYQNALGPVLLPGDPNYSNSAYWDAQATAAINAGLMQSDVSYPAVVAKYAQSDGVEPSDGGGVTTVVDPQDSKVLLSEIVTDICVEAGLTTGQIDVEELEEEVIGYTRTNRTSARAVLEPLRLAFFFDAVESGDKIVFRKKAREPIASIPAEDLGAGVDDAEAQLMEHDRQQESELPAAITVAYKALSQDYQPGTQEARRRAGSSDQAANMELPMPMSDDDAVRIVNVWLYAAWTARTKRTVKLTRAWSAVEPTDIIEANDGTTDYRLRVNDKTEDNGVLVLACEDDDADVWELPVISGSGGTGGPGGGVDGTAGSILEVLDIPLLRVADDYPGIYMAAYSVEDTFPGCVVYRSIDGGSTYEEVGAISRAAIVGQTVDYLPNWQGGNNIDGGTVTVVIHGEGLSSITAAQLYNGGNLCVIGDEVLQFKTATLVGTDTYTLSGLLRGRLGTEREIPDHQVGERFVLLTKETIFRFESPVSLLGQPVLYRAVSVGMTLSSSYDTEVTEQQVALKPLAPVGLCARSNGSTWTATWSRQSRHPAPWLDATDAPIGERSERYRWRVVWGAVEYETGEVTTDTVTFGAGKHYSGSERSYQLQVQQVSDLIGPGYAATFTLA